MKKAKPSKPQGRSRTEKLGLALILVGFGLMIATIPISLMPTSMASPFIGSFTAVFFVSLFSVSIGAAVMFIGYGWRNRDDIFKD